mmetsp:Transcript_8104/g.10398  ORF Transcript_8104/g.10398 Transcript_8104/m.10398 type:complete len:176 (-) Transcript_8104:2177-2704(-)
MKTVCSLLFLLSAFILTTVISYVPVSTNKSIQSFAGRRSISVRYASNNDIDETVEKYGLEAGLFESMKKDDGAASAKDLLAKYGVAYLATSIPLALISFAICYILVDSGVDVAALLGKIGIEVSGNSEKVGTAAIAYAAHKAASPIRFPPTVLLTPVVAKLIGKEPSADEDMAIE